MSEPKLSRAQKRRNAKREEEAKQAAAATSAAPKAPTPEKAKSTNTTPPKQVTPEKLAQALGELKLEDDEPAFLPLSADEVANRMALGTTGKPCGMVTNTFALEFLPKEVYRYIVEFEPPIPPERIKQRRIVLGKFKSEVYAKYGMNFFDGTTLLALQKQPNADFGPSEEGFSCLIRFQRAINTDAKNQGVQEVNTIMNVMSKKFLRRLNMLLIGRSYFYPEPKPLQVRYSQGTPANQQYKMKIYSGFNVSVQPCLKGNLMCIDLVSRVMQERSVRNVMNALMEDCKRAGKSREGFQDAARSALIGSTVICTYNQRPWRIDELDFTKTMNSTFPLTTDSRPAKANTPRERLAGRTGEISFRDYFAVAYPEIAQRNLLPPSSHPACNIPGLIVNQPKKQRTTKQITLLLPELCYLTGLNDSMRSNQSLMKALNTETRLAPSKRVAAISSLMSKIHQKSQEVDAKEGALPIRLSSAPVETKGRVLGSFDIKFPRGKKTLTDNKSFSNDIRSCGFFDGKANVGNWACVYLASDERTALQVTGIMKKLASQQGASLGRVDALSVPNNAARNSDAWASQLNSVIKAKKPAFVLILNPNADTFIYSVVKNICTVTNSVVSQVMDSKKVVANPKMINPICGNTLKQILAKLGYQNWRVDIGQHLPPAERKGAMFVGVDVSHDKLLKGVYGGSRGRRSTVGFVASRNATFHAFNSYISYQDPDTEFITEGTRLMKSALQGYFAENKSFPTSVIIYRDGVGDSQLTTFVRREIGLFKDAFAALNISPKLVVVVVQKRVNLRLFTACPVFAKQAQRCPIQNKCAGRDKYHSPMAGTIVDNDITSAMLSDFYLVPSIAPPGATARPTRFVVMKDELGFTNNADALQNMTNQMCYMYYNWPGPIRVPACVMYAHKAAYLFGKHVTGNPHANLTPNLFYL